LGWDKLVGGEPKDESRVAMQAARLAAFEQEPGMARTGGET
jgi:hypothetical protein